MVELPGDFESQPDAALGVGAAGALGRIGESVLEVEHRHVGFGKQFQLASGKLECPAAADAKPIKTRSGRNRIAGPERDAMGDQRAGQLAAAIQFDALIAAVEAQVGPARVQTGVVNSAVMNAKFVESG